MAERSILRYSIPVSDAWHTLELRGEIIHVATRHEEYVEIWVLDDPAAKPQARAFRVVGTGHPLAPALAIYQGTAITPSGRFVWHLMEQAWGGGSDG